MGNGLTGNTWYDAAGNVIKSQPAGAKTFTKMVYDSLGRAVTTYVGYSAGESSYEEAESLTCNAIVEQSETMFDEMGNVTFTSAYQRMHNATGMGELNPPSGAQPKARVTYTAAWHDSIGRVTASASYGTNGGSAPTRPDSAPSSSDTVLVSTTEYNAVGQAYKTVDPAGREDRQEHDSLGRVVKNIQNYTDGDPSTGGADEDVVVETSYTADGQVATLVAKNSSTGDQTTTYVYGTTLEDSDVARADLLRAEIYPDSDDTANPLGSGQDAVYDRVEFAYNRQGQVIEKTDQNGTVHEYLFDGLGRQTSDRVTSVGTGIDDAVLRLSTTFEKRGLPETLTSYNADTGGTVVNEVKLVHNDFGQLTTEYQEHEGSVETSTTPKVQYTYPDGSGGHIRLQKMTYPNGRVLRTEYNSGLDDAMNRVSYLADDDSGSVGTHLAAYSYLGGGSIVQVDYTEPGIRYDLAHGIGNDPYDGMDRFGRVVDLLWRNYGTSSDVVRIQHGYDRASNRLWREDPVAASYSKDFDELYSYDGMYQLTAMQRGDLNAAKDGLVTNTKTFAEDWALDATGNWSTYKKDTDGDDTWDLNQSRMHNKANEITQIAAASTHVAHDAAGNMTKIPKPDDWADHFDLTFDAWNRLVRVADSAGTVAVYEYDARMFRIGKLSYIAGMAGEIRDFYYNVAWQCLEERVESSSGSSSSGAGTPLTDRQFIWGRRYIDDLILRDRDTTADGVTDERLYALSDGIWSIAGVVDTGGLVKERYRYGGFGQMGFLTDGFISQAGSSHDWEHGLAGYRLDNESGMYHVRLRSLHCGLGRWTQRDKIPGASVPSLYAYVSNQPRNLIDTFGADEVVVHTVTFTNTIATRFKTQFHQFKKGEKFNFDWSFNFRWAEDEDVVNNVRIIRFATKPPLALEKGYNAKSSTPWGWWPPRAKARIVREEDELVDRPNNCKVECKHLSIVTSNYNVNSTETLQEIKATMAILQDILSLAQMANLPQGMAVNKIGELVGGKVLVDSFIRKAGPLAVTALEEFKSYYVRMPYILTICADGQGYKGVRVDQFNTAVLNDLKFGSVGISNPSAFRLRKEGEADKPFYPAFGKESTSVPATADPPGFAIGTPFDAALPVPNAGGNGEPGVQ